jgi:hypothetical protein
MHGEPHSLLPLSFIGDMRNLPEAFLAMLEAANASNTSARGRIQLPPTLRDTLLRFFVATHSHNETDTHIKSAAIANRGKSRIAAEMPKRLHEARGDVRLRGAIARAFLQDYACFGFGLPGGDHRN